MSNVEPKGKHCALSPNKSHERFDNEDKIIETVRQHLREARRNGAVGKLTFEMDINRGGVSRYWVEVLVKYRFIESTGAV